VQLDPIKPYLKPPGTKRLKLKCDEPLSNIAFNFNLRRHIKVKRINGQCASCYQAGTSLNP